MDLIAGKFPRNVKQAVELLVSQLSFGDRTIIANMAPEKLVTFHESMDGYIRTEFRLPGNDQLMESCKAVSGLPEMNGKQASYIIVKILWAKLQDSGVLKVVR